MAKELAKKEEAQLPANLNLVVNSNEEILRTDVVVPRLLLMQGLSDMVRSRKAQQGDMVRSTTVEALGAPGRAVQFIPLTFSNVWILQEKLGGKYEYRGKEPMTASNQDAPWDFMKDGSEWRRVKTLNVFALLPSDIAAEQAEMDKAKKGEMPDPDKALLPIQISFRSTSYQAGKDIVTHFAKAKKFGLPGYVSVLELSCEEEKNDKGAFYVYKVKTGVGKTTTSALEACKYWYDVLATQKVAVDESDDTVAPEANLSSGSQY